MNPYRRMRTTTHLSSEMRITGIISSGNASIFFAFGHPCASSALASFTVSASVNAGYAPASLIASRFAAQLGW